MRGKLSGSIKKVYVALGINRFEFFILSLQCNNRFKDLLTVLETNVLHNYFLFDFIVYF